MKTAAFLPMIFTVCAVTASAQNYTSSQTVDIFGDTSTTYYDQNRNTIKVVKNSTDIFGNKIKSVTGKNGETIRTIKKSKDIFGDDIVDINEGNGKSKTIKTSTDIFGDVNKTIQTRMDVQYCPLKIQKTSSGISL